MGPINDGPTLQCIGYETVIVFLDAIFSQCLSVLALSNPDLLSSSIYEFDTFSKENKNRPGYTEKGWLSFYEL